jgi:hypothetical protein
MRPFKNCVDCGKTEPQDFCWEGRFDCAHQPPRGMNLRDVWVRVKELQRQITALEERRAR